MELLPFKEARYVLKHYGLQHQKAKTIEELAELIVALQKDLLANKDGLSKEVIEEMADVHVMLLQLMVYDEDYFNDVYDEMRYKLGRQQERIRSKSINSVREQSNGL
nr:MAG TPA: nucleoside triphosphate pyrophosphohydrolase [Caudoviricetes sp.]